MVRRYRKMSSFVENVSKDMKFDISPFLNLVYMKIATQAYNELAKLTPVDTGYLRLSLSARLNDAGGYKPGPRRSDKPKFYVQRWNLSQQATMEAIKNFKAGDILTIGYTAKYAPYVEDRVHMVKTVKTMMNGIARRAIAQAKKGAKS